MKHRPVMRYHGGKFKLAPWIIQHMPTHRVYVESYGGAASVLLQKPRCYAEVYNDLDGEIVNVFRVLRNPTQARELRRQLDLTPYAREEFELSTIADGDPIEQARRTLFRFAAGHSTSGTNSEKWQTGFRTYSGNSRSATPAQDWANYSQHIETFTARLRGVYIEQLPAIACMQRYDQADCLHYVDPTYLFETRNKRQAGNSYRHEMTDQDHRDLAPVLHGLAGMVILSGYASPLYDQELYSDWVRVEKRAHADGGRDRVEVLWLNPAAASRQQLRMEVAA